MPLLLEKNTRIHTKQQPQNTYSFKKGQRWQFVSVCSCMNLALLLLKKKKNLCSKENRTSITGILTAVVVKLTRSVIVHILR